MTSGFRSPELCTAIGSSVNSQHAKAEAADFEVIGTDNAELFDWIKNNLSRMTSSFSSSTLQANLTAGGFTASWIDGTPRASLPTRI